MMTAPGLTCCGCGGPLYPNTARRTDDGWKHSTQLMCANYAQALVREETNRARLEDLEWMDETGETYTGAAKRLGMSVAALEGWLRNHGHTDLGRRLLAREAAGSFTRARKKKVA